MTTLPACDAGWSALKSGAFVAEFLTQGRLPLLRAITPRPLRSTLEIDRFAPPVVADLFRQGRWGPAPGIVLVHGLAPEGRENLALRRAASLLSRTGFAVLVPTVDGLTDLRLRPADIERVVSAVDELRRAPGVEPKRLALLGVSVGAGIALLAAEDARVAEHVLTVVSLGGYASMRELLRYLLTGAYQYGEIRGARPPQHEAAAQVLLGNLDLIGQPRDRKILRRLLEGKPQDARALSADAFAVYRLLTNSDPAQVDGLIDRLPSQLRTLLHQLSPIEHLAGLRARLVLLHSVHDPAIPYTESLRLYDAARSRVPVTLTPLTLLAHVEPEARGRAAATAIGEFLQIWRVVYQLVR